MVSARGGRWDEIFYSYMRCDRGRLYAPPPKKSCGFVPGFFGFRKNLGLDPLPETENRMFEQLQMMMSGIRKETLNSVGSVITNNSHWSNDELEESVDTGRTCCSWKKYKEWLSRWNGKEQNRGLAQIPWPFLCVPPAKRRCFTSGRN